MDFGMEIERAESDWQVEHQHSLLWGGECAVELGKKLLIWAGPKEGPHHLDSKPY